MAFEINKSPEQGCSTMEHNMITQDKVFTKLVQTLEKYEDMPIPSNFIVSELPIVRAITASERLLCKQYGISYHALEKIIRQHRARIVNEQD